MRYTLKELRGWAVDEIGFCVGVHWRSVTGSCVPEGMVSDRCRLAYLLFSGWAPAYRFYDLLTRRRADRLPRQKIRLVRVKHGGQTMIGVAVIAVMSPDSHCAEGIKRAPAHERQPGYRRYFQRKALRSTPERAWWEHELGDTIDDGGIKSQELQPGSEYAERQAAEDLERELDRLEAEYDVHGRRAKRSATAMAHGLAPWAIRRGTLCPPVPPFAPSLRQYSALGQRLRQRG